MLKCDFSFLNAAEEEDAESKPNTGTYLLKK